MVRAKVRYFLDEYSKLIRMMAGAEGKEEKVKKYRWSVIVFAQ